MWTSVCGGMERALGERTQEHDKTVKEGDSKSSLSQHQVMTGHTVLSKPMIHLQDRLLGHLEWPIFYIRFVVCNTTTRIHKKINKFVQYLFIYKNIFFSTFPYSQVIQDTGSYKQLPLQQYSTNINFKYIFGERIETYQIHNSDRYLKNAG